MRGENNTRSKEPGVGHRESGSEKARSSAWQGLGGRVGKVMGPLVVSFKEVEPHDSLV